MDLIAKSHGNVSVVAVVGRIDQTTSDLFQAKLAFWLEMNKDGENPLLLDFSGVDYISSVGLRVLMLAARQVKTQHGMIAIAALTPVVAEVFQISRFNKVITVYPDVATALVNLE